VAGMDITERKRMETAALENTAMRQVQHRLLDQREQERQQIAHDLHDGPVQELTGITFALRTLLMREVSSAGIGQEERDQELEAIQAGLQGLIHELRTYAGELRPPTLARFGLEEAIRSHADAFQANHPSLRLSLQLHRDGEKLPENIELSLFRIYQQALNNILKHAQADQALVRLENDDRKVRIEIRDNGRGFELPDDWLSLARHGHLGLLGMRERAEAVGGKLAVVTGPGEGTDIIVTVPLEESAGGGGAIIVHHR
ncbi:MAG TPA: sensor histidine kinase, partial [Anaerolineaceae bacterium]